MTLSLHALLLFVHLLAAVVWLGGMVFAHAVLRPVAVAQLPPPQRLPLMAAALGRFFRLVALAVLALLASGLALLAPVGLAAAPLGWHLMLGLGLVMSLNFGVILLRPWPALRAAVAAQRWPEGAAALDRIRRAVLANLVLGMAVLAAAAAARG